jgi:hypothetical protein
VRIKEETGDTFAEGMARLAKAVVGRVRRRVFEPDRFELLSRFRVGENVQKLIVRREDLIREGVVVAFENCAGGNVLPPVAP